ncbi:hypothetical protein ACRRTK_004336 [Alexandromys fortis]
MHEKLIHELEEERHLRLQSEERLREVTLESERNRIQMRGLQQQFSRERSNNPDILFWPNHPLHSLDNPLDFDLTVECRENNIPEVALKGVVNEEGTAAADEDNLQPSSKGKSDGREM